MGSRGEAQGADETPHTARNGMLSYPSKQFHVVTTLSQRNLLVVATLSIYIEAT